MEKPLAYNGDSTGLSPVRPILDVLAQQIAVQPAIIDQLGINYLPIVEFKKGKSYHGWWTIPERDANKNIIGTSLRRFDGQKSMLPGSKRGYIYPVGNNVSSVDPSCSGPSHWHRIHESNSECPVCNGRNGCLVDSNNLSDPEDVICVRKESQEPRTIGWYHRLKPKATSNGLPTLILEGMSCTATGLDMGFPSIGKPSGSFRSNGLVDMVRGQTVVVLGENDPAGIKGMNQTFEDLASVVTVTRLLPPEDVKDFRQWRAKYGLTVDMLLTEIKQRGKTDRDSRVFATKSSDHVADQFIQTYYTDQGATTLRKRNRQWYEYTGQKYQVVDIEDRVKHRLYEFLGNRSYLTEDGKVKAYDLSRGRVSDVIDALSLQCPIEQSGPCWINGVDGPDSTQLVCFQNGVLDVLAFSEGRVVLQPSTPNYFSLSCLPFDFDEDAVCRLWTQVRPEILQLRARQNVQEWTGLCMVSNNTFETITIFYGPPRSGKSLTTSVLKSVVGKENIAATDLKTLGGTHGRQNLIGKLIAIMGESRTSFNMDASYALDTLLSISGRDQVLVNPKFKDMESCDLTCRFTMLLNSIPALPDYSEALLARLNIVPFNNSFVGREDETLKDRLVEEAPGIAMWGLQGYVRLMKNRKFTVPEEDAELRENFKKVMSPVNSFIEDCFDWVEGGQVPLRMVYEAWIGWSKLRGMSAGIQARLEERLKNISGISVNQGVMRGVELKDGAHTYLGRP